MFSSKTIHAFFHKWCEQFAKDQYPRWCYPPKTQAEIDETIGIYGKCGFPGCFGSIDVVHVAWGRCSAGEYHAYCGKEGYPTVAYEVVVDHLRRILAVVRGQPGARNDKAIVRLDQLVLTVKEGRLYGDVVFMVRTVSGLKTIKGLYMITDGGYHKWRCLQSTDKHASLEAAVLFSKRMESVRKDVECVFGILKKRFTLLSSHIQLQTIEEIDSVFFTCCTLHNMLLADDGWDQRHKDINFWTSAYVDTDVAALVDHLLSTTNDSNLNTAPSVDYSSMGRQPDACGPEVETVVEREQAYSDLRDDLIENFRLQYAAGEVLWLK